MYTLLLNIKRLIPPHTTKPPLLVHDHQRLTGTGRHVWTEIDIVFLIRNRRNPRVLGMACSYGAQTPKGLHRSRGKRCKQRITKSGTIPLSGMFYQTSLNIYKKNRIILKIKSFRYLCLSLIVVFGWLLSSAKVVVAVMADLRNYPFPYCRK